MMGLICSATANGAGISRDEARRSCATVHLPLARPRELSFGRRCASVADSSPGWHLLLLIDKVGEPALDGHAVQKAHCQFGFSGLACEWPLRRVL
jgi:hypothetical protein